MINLDAITQGRSLLSPDKLDVLYHMALSTSHLPGHMAELGVYKGGSAAVLAHASPHKPLHLFDSLGLPEDDVSSVGHRKGEFSADELELLRFLTPYNVEFHLGVFPETARGLEYLQFSLVHIDCDLTQTVEAAVKFFRHRMCPFGRMVFDDFGWSKCPGVKEVVERNFSVDRIQVLAEFQAIVLF